MRILLLRIGREMAIDQRLDIELVQQGVNQGQRPGVDDILRARRSAPGKGSHRDPPRRSQQRKRGIGQDALRDAPPSYAGGQPPRSKKTAETARPDMRIIKPAPTP